MNKNENIFMIDNQVNFEIFIIKQNNINTI